MRIKILMDKIDNANELSYMLWSILCGVVMTIAYDFLRARRREKTVKGIFVYIEDTAWFALLGIIIYLLAFRQNAGEIRLYSFIGIGFGAFIYKILFGDLVMELLRKIYSLFVKVMFFTMKVVLYPVYITFKIIKRPINVVVWHTKKGSRVFDDRKKIIKAKISNRIRFKAKQSKNQNNNT